MAVTREDLELLQSLQIKSLVARLKEDIQDGIPTDAATLGVIQKVLKDNNVTVDPADNGQLNELRRKLAEARNGPRLSAVVSDLKEATG